jgi:hypothetical protein
MCSELHIRDGNLWIEQTRELAAAIGRENILYWGDGEDDEKAVPEPSVYAGDDLAWCLCPVDIKSTLERLGYKVVDGWREPEMVDFVAFKEPTP